VSAISSENGEPVIFPPNSNPYGLTYAEWTIRWWQWLLSIPRERNPLTDTTGRYCHQDQHQHGPIWFLVATEENRPVVSRECKVPANRALMYPINNSLFSLAEYPQMSMNDLKARSGEQEDAVISLYSYIDGSSLPDLARYRIRSDDFEVDLPPSNILDSPPGRTRAVSDGYWIILKPLSPGTHELRFGASGSFRDRHFSTDITYHLWIL
jgi:hypothetical protein